MDKLNYSRSLAIILMTAISLLTASGSNADSLINGSNQVHVQGCETCHANVDVAKIKPHLYTSNCIICHSPGGSADTKGFTQDSFSNLLQIEKYATKSGTWRSHNAYSQKLLRSSVGSQEMAEPTNMNNAKGSGHYMDNTTPDPNDHVLTCGICHNVHTPDGGNPSDQTKLLRDANNNDQICYNCHRERVATSSIATGSHPVDFTYSSAKKKYAGQAYLDYSASFKSAPKNRNPLNKTSDLGNYFKGGKIVCSTCHSVHLGDSDSATFDNWSTAAGTNGQHFSESEGFLLRTNNRGTAVTDTNICLNCHKDEFGSKTRQHSNRGQQVQCVDCHGAHVYNGTGSMNNKLIAQQINFSSARGSAKGKTIVFTPISSLYKNNGNGICEVCHVVPTSAVNPKYPAEHAMTVAKNSDCNACHSHGGSKLNDVNPATGFSFDAGACSNCHGYPPAPKATQLFAYTVDETLTPHSTHAGNVRGDSPANYSFDCVECHYSGQNINFHKNSIATDLFKEAGPIGTKNGATPVYNPDKTCSTVYCHSDGNGNYVVTPVWVNGKGSLAGNCNACHSAQPVTGSHTKHVADGGINKSYPCQTCHAATVNGTNAIIKVPSAHVDGTKDLKFFNASFSATGTGNVTCSNTCHYDPATGIKSNPSWTNSNTGKCGTCHATSPTITVGATQTIATKSHTIHLTSIGGPELGEAITACQNCHVYTTETASNHVDGSIDTIPGACNSCHPGVVVSAMWGNSNSVTCQACHTTTASVVTNSLGTFTAPLVKNYTTMGHGKVVNALNAPYDCSACHDKNAAHIGVDVMVNYTGPKNRLTRPINDICFECHNTNYTQYFANISTTYKRITNTHRTAKGQVTPDMTCTSCHDPHGSMNVNGVQNLANLRANIKFHPDSTAVNIVLTNYSSFVQFQPPYRGFCQVCHTTANYFRRGVAPFAGAGEDHTDGNHRRCTMCHDHNAANYAFQPIGGGSCNGCHGYPPASSAVITSLGVTGNYSTAKVEGAGHGGGAHTVQGHIPKTATAQAGNGNCSNCHFQNAHASGTVNVNVNPQFTFRTGTPIVYNSGTNTCSNVSCHFQTTPSWK